MFTKTYIFADRAVRITAGEPFADTAETARFLASSTAAPVVEITVDASASVPAPPPEHTLLGGRVAMWRVGDEVFRAGFSFKLSASTSLPFSLSRRRGNRISVYFDAARVASPDARMILEAAGLADIMIELGCTVLHSSCVLHRGRGLIFCGPSGAGKSTQAELWRQYAGAEIINGDRTLMRPTDRGVDACGVIYCGTSGICYDRTAPVRAIMLISHGGEELAAPAAPRTAFRALLSQMTYNIGDPEAVAKATAICADIVSRVPVLSLSCRPDAAAVEYLQNYLGRLDNL